LRDQTCDIARFRTTSKKLLKIPFGESISKIGAAVIATAASRLNRLKGLGVQAAGEGQCLGVSFRVTCISGRVGQSSGARADLFVCLFHYG
jgi:hypothetical protein